MIKIQGSGSAVACLFVVSALSAVSRHASATPVESLDWYGAQDVSDEASSSGGQIKLDSSNNVVLTSLYSHSVAKFALGLQGQPQSPTVLWDTPVPVNQSGNLVIDAFNNVYVNGTSSDTSKSYVGVVKLNSSGQIVWSQKYAVGPVSEHMSGGGMAIAPNGNLYVLARPGNQSATTAPATLLRIDSASRSGSELGRRALGNTPDLEQGMTDSALAVDGSSNVYYGDARGLLAFPADLSRQIWSWSSALPVRAITVDRGNVYATGTVNHQGSWAMYVARIKASDGTNLSSPYQFDSQFKSQSYPVVGAPQPPADGDDTTSYGGNAIAVDSGGSIYVAGYATVGSISSGVVAKFNASNGQRVWYQLVGYSGLDGTCRDVALDASGNVFGACTDMRQNNGSSTATCDIFDATSGNQKMFLNDDGPGGEDDVFDHVLIGKPVSGKPLSIFLLDEAAADVPPRTIYPTIFKYSVTGL